MKKTIATLILILLITLVLSGCGDSYFIICEKPEIRDENIGCCLDRNENNLCDYKETEENYNSSYCGDYQCVESWVGDNHCDLVCYNEDCNWDEGDCDDLCVPGCLETYLGDGHCDIVCDIEICNYDNGDCESQCNHRCPDYFIDDGYCDMDCFVEACDYDGDDCAELCSPGCFDEWLGDGYCNYECNNEECDWDKGDCR